jgi:hypothetical protein
LEQLGLGQSLLGLGLEQLGLEPLEQLGLGLEWLGLELRLGLE